MSGESAVVRVVDVALEGESLRLCDPASGEQLEIWGLSSLELDEIQEGGVVHVYQTAQRTTMLSTRDLELIKWLRVRAPTQSALPGGTRPVRYALRASLLIGALALLFYWGIPSLSRAIAQRVPMEFERQLELPVRALFEKRYCEDEAVRTALAELKTWVDPQGAVDAELEVLCMSDVNAFALPGGSIALSGGLLAAAESPEEIAGVLAHELTHVQQRHVMSHFVRDSLFTAGWSIAVGDYAGLMVIDPGVALQIASLRFSRDEEAAADEGARLLLEQARISGRGLQDFFERLRATTDAVPEWLSTHPKSEARARTFAPPASSAPSSEVAFDAVAFETLQRACDNNWD